MLLTVPACREVSVNRGDDEPAPAEVTPDLDLANRPAVTGIARTVLRDDESLMISRIRFDPGAGETLHTHPFDLVVIPLGSGAVEWEVGDVVTDTLALGDVQFVQRGVAHRLVNRGESSLEIIAIAVRE
jgi:quercetin dioxygenase-like cupin family protein